ncbi:MAG: GIDE domain-containing protein [Candidatus Sedimenticola sp. PURPLELP]
MMHISTGEFWFFLALAVAASGAGFWFAFRSLMRARIIEDTPTARVRSAQQGYVELNGSALSMEGEPIRAPLTGTDCCWFRYKIEKRGDKNWRTIESQSSDSLFLLKDQTGECIIDPEGAEVTPSDRSVWYGSSREPANRTPDRNPVMRQPAYKLVKFLNTDLSPGFGNRYRYTEERIYSGDMLYSIGMFKTLDDMDHAKSRKELAMQLLRDWKQDQVTMLKRFDKNGDGQIDMQEWEKVRRTAAAEAGKEYAEQMENQVMHTLSSTGSRRHPFLISTLPEFNLVRRYRLYAAGSIAAFFIAGGIAVWLIGNTL